MPDLILSSPQRANVLDIYQRGIAAALTKDSMLAIVHLLAVLEWVTPTTWPIIYHDVAVALSAAYMVLDQGDLREHARRAAHWHQEAHMRQLPLSFPDNNIAN